MLVWLNGYVGKTDTQKCPASLTSCSGVEQEDGITRTAMVSQGTYGPLEAAFLTYTQIESLSSICLEDQERKPFCIKKNHNN